MGGDPKNNSLYKKWNLKSNLGNFVKVDILVNYKLNDFRRRGDAQHR